MKALLIVDVQNDFCPGGSLAVSKGDEVVPIINKLINSFETVIASKDWHPQETVHFEKWPVHCVAGSHGAEFHASLQTEMIEEVFLKGTGNKDDGYSAFEATSNDLEQFLKSKGVTELFITGLATDYCVKASALDAVARGFKTFVIADAIKGVEANTGDTALACSEMAEAGIKFIKSVDIEGR